MKTFILALVALSSLSTFGAGVNKLIIQNDTNRNIVCAFTQYDAPANKWITYSWFLINNGQVGNFTNVSYYRCEEVETNGNGVTWGNTRNFCVVRGNKFVNPYHRSENFQLCQNFGGEWRGFDQLPNQTNYTLYLNP